VVIAGSRQVPQKSLWRRLKEWIFSLVGWESVDESVSTSAAAAAATDGQRNRDVHERANTSEADVDPSADHVQTNPIRMVYLSIGVGSMLIVLALIRRLDLSNAIFPSLLAAIVSTSRNRKK